MKKTFTAEEAKEIGEQLGVDWSKWDVEQFRMGMDVELEHGTIDPNTNVTNDDALMTGKIALAHLNELPDYYTRLEEMEKEGIVERVESPDGAENTSFVYKLGDKGFELLLSAHELSSRNTYLSFIAKNAQMITGGLVQDISTYQGLLDASLKYGFAEGCAAGGFGAAAGIVSIIIKGLNYSLSTEEKNILGDALGLGKEVVGAVITYVKETFDRAIEAGYNKDTAQGVREIGPSTTIITPYPPT